MPSSKPLGPLGLLQELARQDPNLNNVFYVRLRELPILGNKPGTSAWSVDVCCHNDKLRRHFTLAYPAAIRLIAYLRTKNFERAIYGTQGSVWFWHRFTWEQNSGVKL